MSAASQITRTYAIDAPPFGGWTGAGVRVAVIDSGIAAGHPHVGTVAAGVHVTSEGDEDEDTADQIGHGTAVAAAIREKAPAAELVPIRVFDRHLSTTAEALARGIRSALRLQCRLLNLSLGTANPARRAVLLAAVEEACDAGAIVVSPGEHDGVAWLPGSLPGAIPAHLDWTCPRDGLRLVRHDDARVMLHASGYPRPIPGVEPQRNLHGISFAAANITGMLARWMEGAPNVRRAEDVLRSLRGERD